MAATGFSPVYLYASGTAGHIPLAANLTNTSNGSEIALNYADGNLFFKNSSNSVITTPLLQSSSTQSGWLSSTDWTTFNSKQPAGTYVTSVTGTAPVVSSGGTTPAISMAAATSSVNGYLTSTDWSTFNNKQAALVSGTNIKTVSGVSLLGSGDVGTIGTAYGGTGVTSFVSTGVPYATSTSVLTTTSALTFSGSILTVKSASGYGSVYVDNTGTTGGGYVSLRQNGSQIGVVGVSGAILGTTDSNLAVFAESGGAVNIYTNGSTTLKAQFPSAGGMTVNTSNITCSAGNFVVGTSGKGIDFSAVVHAGSSSKLLADYEEGTWTPLVTDGTNNATMLAGSNEGKYIKVGKMVAISAQVTVNTINSVGAGARIAGLPFANGATEGNRCGVAFGYGSSLNITANQACTGYIEAYGNSYINLYKWDATTGTSAMTGAQVSDGGGFFIQAVYLTN